MNQQIALAPKTRDVYHSEGVTDLQTYKTQAEKRYPEETVIHDHPFEEPCGQKYHWLMKPRPEG